MSKRAPYFSLSAIGVWIGLPLLLLLGGFVYGLMQYRTASFFTLNYYHQRAKNQVQTVPLMHHTPYRFTLQAQKDNFGTIAVRFKFPDDEVRGEMTFTLSAGDTGETLFVGHYDLEKMYAERFYPLGFPEITHSQGKKYIVNLEAAYTTDSPISVYFGNTSFITKYHVAKINPIRNPSVFFPYLKTKLENLVPDVEFRSYILLYILPTILYFTWKLMNNKYITAVLLLFIIFRIYYSVYVVVRNWGSEAELYFQLATLVFFCLKFDVKGNLFFSIATVLFLLSTLYVFMSNEPIAREYAIWTYYFMALAIIAYVKQEYESLFVNFAVRLPKTIQNKKRKSL